MSATIDDVPTDVLDADDSRDDAGASLRLVVTWADHTIVRNLAAEGTLVLGRGSDSDVRVDHASVSRRHVALGLGLGERLTIEDLGSANGTRIDGERVASGATVALRPGALVEIGKVLLVVQDARAAARAAEDRRSAGDGVVVADPEMARVHDLVALVAKSALSVILLGETGVGKEVLASRVHRLSPRADAPFLKVNCAALVESLLEAELFGYERGAFTGANQAKAGLLESADGGTLFLDELGEMPLATQAKLLRVLESGEVTRVGGIRPRKLDVRFVSATNRDLRELASVGRFRQDLFFRLDGASILVPPLRRRRLEIGRLADVFLAEACRVANRPPLRFADDARAALAAHGWPGNVRELRNVVARAALLTPGTVVTAADLRFETLGAPPPTDDAAPPLVPVPAPGGVAARGAAATPRPDAEEVADTAPSRVDGPDRPDAIPAALLGGRSEAEERKRIADALEQCGGNQTRAAKLLGVARGTLLKRLDLLGFTRPRTR